MIEWAFNNFYLENIWICVANSQNLCQGALLVDISVNFQIGKCWLALFPNDFLFDTRQRCVSGQDGKFWHVGDDSMVYGDAAGTKFTFQFCGHSQLVIRAPNGLLLKGEQNGLFKATGTEIDATTRWEFWVTEFRTLATTEIVWVSKKLILIEQSVTLTFDKLCVRGTMYFMLVTAMFCMSECVKADISVISRILWSIQ